MNNSEKQRALLLEKITVSASPLCNMKINMCIAVLMAAAVCALEFTLWANDSEAYFTVLINVGLAFAITADFCFLGAMYDYKNKILDSIEKISAGAYNTGTFASVLPFKASDMRYYRLERCQKQVFTMWLLTSIYMLAISAAGYFGFDTYSGIIGLTVLMTVPLEIIFTAVSLLCRSWVIGIIIVSFSAAASLIFITMMFEILDIAGAFDDITADHLAALNEKLGGLSVLSGVTGIIILAAAFFAVVN
ncbi:MAG: hypothetical protein K2G04_10550, partial [Oscillospiraceae bacterium]|nr:hypothetical protein [Oscillospiraceae bacterium]